MAETINSPLRSNTDLHPIPLPLPPPATATSPEIPLSPPPATAAKAERGAGGGAWYAWSGGRGSGDGSRVVTGIVRRGLRAEAARRAAVAARAAATALCLIAFSVLAADRHRGWTFDSYAGYKQFRYCVGVNVIGFVYSGFQLYAQVHHMIKEKHIIRRPMGDYFDFAMDQILAYLLISAASSATARTADWVSNWGTDPFPSMANGSIAVQFLAFLAFALCSLISAYNLLSKSI